MIKMVIGGSPCTKWSIARGNDRETEPEGIGWELFKNFVIAVKKFKPDLFLYENNKSAAQPIKDQICRELGVDLMYINSARVSAQSRDRFYVFNWEVEQPEDRGIVLRDILETSANNEKTYELAKVCEIKTLTEGEMLYLTRAEMNQRFITRSDAPKSKCVTANFCKGVPYNVLAEPVRIGTIENNAKDQSHDSKQYRVYSPDGKATTLCGEGGGLGAKTGIYACPYNETLPDLERHVYEVINGEIEIKGKKYPIKLPDGLYIFRKLTPVECERLQTLPDGYTAAVSNTQRYRGLGNGWTAEVIIHILNGALKDVPRDEEIVVLSMYDGIGTGRYCLDKMGFTNVTYYAYEIDEPAMKVALSNYPDIIQLGDAFDLRRDDWEIGKRFEPKSETKAEPDAHDQVTDLSDAPKEIKCEILQNDETLTAKETEVSELVTSTTPNSFSVIDQINELITERKKLHTIDEDNPRYERDIIALEYVIKIMEVLA